MKQNYLKPSEPILKFLNFFKNMYQNILSNKWNITWEKFSSFTSKKELIFTGYVSIINRLVSSFGYIYLNIKIFIFDLYYNNWYYINILTKIIIWSIILFQIIFIYIYFFVVPLYYLDSNWFDFNSKMLPEEVEYWKNSSELVQVAREWNLYNNNNLSTNQEIDTISSLQTTNLDTLNSNTSTSLYDYSENNLNDNNFDLELELSQLKNDYEGNYAKESIRKISNDIKILNQELVNIINEAKLKGLNRYWNNISNLTLQEKNEFYNLRTKQDLIMKTINNKKNNITKIFKNKFNKKIFFKDLKFKMENNNAILFPILILNKKTIKNYIIKFNNINKIIYNIKDNIINYIVKLFNTFNSKKEIIFTDFVSIKNHLVYSFSKLYINIKFFIMSKFNWFNLNSYINKLNKYFYNSILLLQVSSITFFVCFVLPFEIINPELLEKVNYEKLYAEHYQDKCPNACNAKADIYKTLIKNLKIIQDNNNNNDSLTNNNELINIWNERYNKK